MLKAKEFANAMTIVWLGAYIVCAFVAIFLPSLYLGVAGTWFHAMTLQMSTRPTFSPTSILVGFITFGLIVWTMSYLFALIYNKLAK